MTDAARSSPGPLACAAWRRRPLYADFYGLAEPPFDLAPNPRFLFLSSHQREAMCHLRYAMASARGFMLMLGEAGTGKTTLVRAALAEFGDAQGRYVLVNNPTMDRAEFYELLAEEFGLDTPARGSKIRFLRELQGQAEARFAAGGLTGLVIDEAQSLPHALLEEVRLLGNLETATAKLMNIILCGQPELADRLNEASWRPLKQRIALRCELKPLTLEETSAYIISRLRLAGGTPHDIFSIETLASVFEASQGIPRLINVICDNALLAGFAAQTRPVRADIIREVCADFDLTAASPSSTEATGAARQRLLGTPAHAGAPSAAPLQPPAATVPSRPRPLARPRADGPPMFASLNSAPRRKWFGIF